MRDTAFADRSDGRPSPTGRAGAGHPIELWRLRGPHGELRGLAVETPLGYAFFIEPAAEVVLARLHHSVESMVAFADGTKTLFVAEGWQAIEAPHEWRAH